MKLIVEDDRDVCRATVISESEESKRDGKYHPFMISGTFAIAERVNKNNRRYPYEILKEQFDRVINEDFKEGRLFGQFEHPASKCTEQEERELAAIKIEEIEPDEPNKLWKGKARLMCSDPDHHVQGLPKADIARAYYNFCNDTIFGFSTRGYGDLAKSKIEEEAAKNVQVLTNFYLATIDLVMNPSCAQMAHGILESKEFMIDTHGYVVECALNEYERGVNASARTYDLAKKREILDAAWNTLLKKL